MIDSTWTWRQLTPAAPPSGRNMADMIWDGARAILFGGEIAGPTESDGCFELVGDEWNELSPVTRPSARLGHHMAWDGSRILLVGGAAAGDPLDDTWEYAADNWSELFPANTLPDYNPSGSPGRSATFIASQLIWDGTRFLLLYPVFDPVNLTTTWQYASADWTRVTASPEYPNTSTATEDTWNAAMCWAGDRAVAGGGKVSLHTGAVNAANTCEFDGSGWTQTVSGGAWTARYGMRFAWTGAEVVTFGGAAGAGPSVRNNELWTYSKATGIWTQITAAGTPPSARCDYSMVWDGDRIVLFGGNVASDDFNGETWVLERPLTAAIRHTFGLG